MNRQTVKIFLIILKVIITVLFVIVVNKAIPTDRTNLVNLIPLKLLVITSLLSLLATALHAYRWYLFLKLFGMNPSIGQCFRSYLEGVVFGIITPGRAGELFRGFTLNPEWRKRSSIAVVTEKITATIVLFITGMIAWLFLPGNRGGDLYSTGLTVVTVLSILAIFIIPRVMKYYLPQVSEIRRRFAGTLLISIPIHAILLIQIVILVIDRLPVTVFQASTAAASAFSAMQFMPVTIANMGVREFCLSMFFQLYTSNVVSIESIQYVLLSTSLIIIFANLILPAFPGMILLLISKLNGIERRR